MRALWLVPLGVVLAAIALIRLALGDMLREEACTRLSRIPFALIRLARARLPEELRDDLAAEWEAELEFVLTGTAGLPVTRLVRGIRYSAGLLFSARAITAGLMSGETRRGSRAWAMFGFAGVAYGALGVGAGIALLVAQGMPIAEFVGGTCMALTYATGGILVALPRLHDRWHACPVPPLLGCASNVTFYLYQGGSVRLLWAAAWFSGCVVMTAVEISQRRGQKQYEQLIAEHVAMFPDCPDCPLAMPAG